MKNAYKGIEHKKSHKSSRNGKTIFSTAILSGNNFVFGSANTPFSFIHLSGKTVVPGAFFRSSIKKGSDLLASIRTGPSKWVLVFAISSFNSLVVNNYMK